MSKYIKNNEVKKYLNSLDVRVSKDLYCDFDEQVELLLLRASQRAQENHRTVVMSKDL